MLTAESFLFFLALLFIAIVIEPITNRVRIPFSIVLVSLGYFGSEIVTGQFGIDTGIRWNNFQPIIFNVILPVLIFQAAIEIDLGFLKKNLLPIIILALPLMVISAALTAACVYYGIAHPSGFPWIAALLTGTLLSATDPAAVLSLLKNTNAPKRLSILLEGESLFNDATAIVLFSIFITIAVSGGKGDGWESAVAQFLAVFFGGLSIGIMVGLIGLLLIKFMPDSDMFVIITIIITYSSFLLAENVFHLSGVMAVLSAGLIIGFYYGKASSPEDKKFVGKFWEVSAYTAEALMFILAGVTITISMFTDQWLAILIGIFAVLIARIIVIFGMFPLINFLPRQTPFPIRHQVILTWGGIRGTVTLALALSLPLELDYWYTIQSIAYGVVLFTLFVQTTTINSMIKILNINKY